jgi:hypothetical protein
VRAGERVLTPEGLLGVIVSLHRRDYWEYRRLMRGPWYAVVEHDDGSRRRYLERSLCRAEAWEEASEWRP